MEPAISDKKGQAYMKVKVLAVLMLMSLIMVGSWMAVSWANDNKGAERIELNGGQRGNVSFPHRQHQNNLGDCKICHSVFPQKAGIIAELKAEGKLKQKHVMNKLCTKCHKEKKKAGQPSGPTTCSKCHIK
jgi:hypothetical protein